MSSFFIAALVAATGAFGQAPANDVCGGAEVIPAAGPFPYQTAITDIITATDTGDPISSCQSNAHLGVWYAFTPSVSGVYSFSTCSAVGGGTTVSDTVIGVYTSATGCAGPFTQLPGGTGVGCDDDGCYSTAQSVLGAPLTAGTTYYVVVQKWSTGAPSAGNGFVQLRVGMGAGNDACSAAQALTLNAPISGSNQSLANDLQLPSGSACFTGVGQTSNISAGPDAVYSFTAPTAGKYSFRVSRWDRETINPVLYVSTDCPSGAAPDTVAACLGAANRTAADAIAGEEVWCLPLGAGDTVYSTVDATSSTAKGTPYRIEVTACDQEIEPNDTVATASALACGIQGGTATSSDIDFFDLGVGAAGDRVFSMVDAVSANSSTFDLRVTSATTVMEYDDADVDTAFGASAPVIAGRPLTGAQTYLRLSASSASEPYRLYSVVQPALTTATSEAEPNNTILQAQMASYVSGALSSATDVDVYAFTAAAGDLAFIALDADPLRNATPFNGALALHDQDGNEIVRVNDSNSSSSNTAPTDLTSTTPRSPAEGIVWRIPASGTYFVRVFAGSSSSSGDYLLSISRNCAPSIAVTKATPSVGSPNGGDTITVTGANFEPGFTVTIDGVAVTPSASSATSFTFTTPPHASATVKIVVTNPDGSAGSTSYIYAPPPTITNLSKTAGTTLGGDTVVITGTFFQTGASVFFGGVAGTVTDINGTGTQITVTTPPGTAGLADVTVTNTDGQTVTQTGAFTYVSPPAVTAITLNTGLGDDTVVITGTDFQLGATVSFDGAAAQVTFDDSTQLTVIVPGHLPGAVDVIVTNPDAQSTTVAGGFTYDSQGPAPTVDALAPAVGSDLGGEPVVITGTGFFADATVFVDGAAVPASDVTVDSATQITFVTPAHAFGTVDVTVRNRDFQTGTLSPGFTFAHAAPTVTAIAPPGGNIAGGTNVTVTGTEFLSGATFTVGGVPATNVTVVNATTLTGTTGAHAAGAVDVIVTNADLQTATLPAAFTYAVPPVATSVAPNQGSTLGGEPFTITGTEFQTGATVTFGGTAATNLTVTSTQITGTTPARAAGAVNVVVTNPDGQKSTLTNAFTFIRPPTATAVAPSSGPISGGTAISIAGVNFVTGATVTVGGTAANNVTFVSANQLTATTPPGAEGTVDVSVTNPDGQVSLLPGAFTYVAAPVVTTVSPNSGSTQGGALVTIDGDKFLPGASVIFGATQVSATFVSATQLTATAPQAAAGTVDVAVKNPDGQSGVLAGAFTYLAPAALTAVAPANGPAAGGTQVTLTGVGFGAGATVTFGGVAATGVTVVDAQTVTVTAPAHAAGFVDVTLSNTDGSSATLTQAFRYVDGPSLASIAPATGSTRGGITVAIAGDNFASGTTVSFGGVPAASVVFESTSALVATTPAHALGVVDVVVTNPDGQSATLASAFTFEAVGPAINVITPAQGPGDGNTPVIVGGSGFVTGATVTFGGVAATEVEVVNGNSITLRTPAHEAGDVDVVVTNPDGVSATATNGYRYTSSPTDPDADAGVDAGTPDAGQPDAGQLDYQGGSTGCGCASTDGASLAGFALLGLVLLVSRRRRFEVR